MLKKLLQFIHKKGVQLSAAAGTFIGGWMFAKGWVDEEASIKIAGALTAILCVLSQTVVAWIATKFARDAQVIAGIEVDGYAGPVTRAVTGVPKLHADGTPILPAIPLDPK